MGTFLRLTVFTILILCSGIELRAAGPYLTLDLNVPTAGFSRYHGTAGEGRYGVPVFGGFDCDGDGNLDYGFSQMTADPLGRSQTGQVTWILGDGTIGEKPNPADAAYTRRVITVIGDQDYEVAGSEVWMDDVNGDGLGDLLVARQSYSKNGTNSGEGALTVIFGGAAVRTWAETLTHFDLRNPPVGAKMVTILGAAPGDRVGIWMRAGDVNGDGISDIVVGADMIDSPTRLRSGGVYVIQGGPHLESQLEIDLADFGQAQFLANLQSKVALVLPPSAEENYHFGATVTVADLDGNGRAEVIAGATLNRAGAVLGPDDSSSPARGGTVRGSMFIAWDENFPPGPWPNGYTFHVTEPLLGDFTRIDGEMTNRSFGEELIGGEDFSGDGFPELFVGDLVGTSPNGSNSGIGHIFYNAAKLRGRSFDMDNPPADLGVTRVFGPIPGAIGADTMAHGDFDNDGIADLACGNPHDAPVGRSEAGSVHVFYGQPGGWPEVINLAPNSLPPLGEMRILEIAGGRAGDVLCYSASSGDINRDGFEDLIVNEMTGDGFDDGDGPDILNVGNMIIVDGELMGSAPTIDLFSEYGGLADFGGVSVGSSSSKYVLIRSMSGTVAGLMPVVVGPEAASYEVGLTQPAGDVLLVEVLFSPNATGPQGAALEVAGLQDPMPLRIGLRGVGESLTCIENDFFEFGEATLMRFGSDFGSTYLPMVNESLEVNRWVPLGPAVIGTGSWTYLHDGESSTSGERTFYKVTRQP